jgi:hypothetical protein
VCTAKQWPSGAPVPRVRYLDGDLGAWPRKNGLRSSAADFKAALAGSLRQRGDQRRVSRHAAPCHQPSAVRCATTLQALHIRNRRVRTSLFPRCTVPAGARRVSRRAYGVSMRLCRCADGHQAMEQQLRVRSPPAYRLDTLRSPLCPAQQASGVLATSMCHLQLGCDFNVRTKPLGQVPRVL